MKYLIAALVFVLFSCSPPAATNEASDSTTVVDNTVDDPESEGVLSGSLVDAGADVVPTDTSQIVSFDSRAAISIVPDTTWINREQKSMDEESWNTIVDDYAYYDMDAADTLESIGVKTLYREAVNKRYLKFRLSDNDVFILDRNKIPGAWGFILFNGKDIPSLYPSIDVPLVMDSIFRK